MKKKICMAVLGFFIVGNTFSQFVHGDMLIGGSLLASVNTSDNIIAGVTTQGPSASTLYFGPSYGYFLSDKWMIGARLAMSISNTTLYDADGQSLDLHFKRNSFGGGPIVRYYPWQNEHVDIWLGAGMYFGAGENTDESIGYEANGDTYIISNTDDLLNYSIGIGPGASFIFNEHWRLELACGSLGFSGYTTKDQASGNTYRQSGYSLNLGSVGFGIAFKF